VPIGTLLLLADQWLFLERSRARPVDGTRRNELTLKSWVIPHVASD